MQERRAIIKKGILKWPKGPRDWLKKEYYYKSVTKKRETQISMSQTQHKLKVKSQMMTKEIINKIRSINLE